jgi:hypothetical protein
MDSKQLSSDDTETLKLELKNSINGRQRRIRSGVFTSICGLFFTLTFYYLDIGRLSVALALVSFVIMLYGLFNIASWTMFSKSIKKLQNDFDNGVKHVGQFRISSYNHWTRKVTMDNGLKVDSLDIADDWKTGDQLYIEKLPTSDFILKCEKNAR